MKKYFFIILSTIIICFVGCNSDNSNTPEIQSNDSISATTEYTTTTTTNIVTTTIATTMTTTTTTTEPNLIEYYYNDIQNLTINDCKKEGSGVYAVYKYNGITIPDNDISTLFKSKKTINRSAFYDSLAKYIDGFSVGNAWDKYAYHIIGYTPETKEQFASMINDLDSFIISSDSFYDIYRALYKRMNKSEWVNTSKDDKKYTIEILDTKALIKDLNICDEMFAYILGALSDGGSSISLSDNTARIIYTDYFDKLDF